MPNLITILQLSKHEQQFFFQFSIGPNLHTALNICKVTHTWSTIKFGNFQLAKGMVYRYTTVLSYCCCPLPSDGKIKWSSHLDHSSLSDYPESSVHRRARVLLHPNNRQAESSFQFWMSHMSFLEPKSLQSNQSFTVSFTKNLRKGTRFFQL